MSIYNIAIRYSEENFNKITSELSMYNIIPKYLGSWDQFNFIIYKISDNELTNGSSTIISPKFTKLCNTVDDFVYNVIKIITKSFIKTDLKSGMVIKTKRGNKYLVVDNLLINNYGYNNLDSYNEDLTHKYDSTFDIIEVFEKRNYWGFGFKGGIQHGDIIWKRIETVELTLQEIADKFNIPVSKLKIKE